MQPTAQAVGKKRERNKPHGGKKNSSLRTSAPEVIEQKTSLSTPASPSPPSTQFPATQLFYLPHSPPPVTPRHFHTHKWSARDSPSARRCPLLAHNCCARPAPTCAASPST